MSFGARGLLPPPVPKERTAHRSKLAGPRRGPTPRTVRTRLRRATTVPSRWSGHPASPKARVAAAATAAVVSKGKEATAPVEVGVGEADQFGSAFCIDASGLFVTAAHVVAPVVKPNTGTVRLILYGGELRQKVVAAQVVRSDAELDLAVLKIDSSGMFR